MTDQQPKTTQSERDVRIAKVKDLQSMGVPPYAQSFTKRESIADLMKIAERDGVSDSSALLESGAHNTYATAGRVISFRSHGKLSFAKLRDNTGDIQICFVKDLVKLDTGKEIVAEIAGTDIYKFVQKYIDVADFLGVRGELFITKHGELTIFANEIKMLSKAIRPLPEKRHGLKDQEACYRQRYLDMTMNEETYNRFLLKSKFYKALRDFYHSQWFIELETSILGNAASGAAAKPFITHHNDFDADFYLRIAFETALKKATVGRFEKVFEIGRDFRNEGSDPSHVQEFTQVEHYAAYRNYEDNMRFTEQLFDHVFDALQLDRKIQVKDKEGTPREVNFATPFERIDYVAGVNKASGLDITQYTMDDADKLRNDIKAKGIEFAGMDSMGTTTLIDYLYKKVLRPTILGPAFIYNYPKIMQPLARISDTNPSIVEQFQLLVNGREICKAYSELVDPLMQQANFDEQSAAIAAGDEEATAEDKDFVQAMEHGMPCQSGFGMGLERILAILTSQDNLRDVIMFPLMKPEANDVGRAGITGQPVEEKKSNQTPTNVSSPKIEKPGCNETLEENKIPSLIREGQGGFVPTASSANALAEKYLTETLQHCRQVGKVMQYFAKKLGEDENLRYVAWLLHDVDRDHIGKVGDKHLTDDFERIMDEVSMPQSIRNDIKSHAHFLTGVQPETLLAKYLVSIDELTGFIHAYSLMRPEGLENMQRSSLNKKLKDKKFAAGVNRDEVKNCEKFLGIEVSVFAMEVVEAMK